MGFSDISASLMRQRVSFRSISDLNRDILEAIPLLPFDIDLVVGVPRSGMLAASILALHLNCDLSDVESFRDSTIFQRGHSRTKKLGISTLEYQQVNTVLILDDSVYSGREMARVKSRLADLPKTIRLIFGAVYVSEQTKSKVDFYFKIVGNPRVFEWNIMHHQILREACVDLDGVLCRNPTEQENDDDVRYREFLLNADSFLVPTVPLGHIVTCRLEKYRKETEAWLSRHGIQYDELVMMDLPDKQARVELGHHGRFKAKICRDSGAKLFIESSEAQALQIAQYAAVDVYCVDTQRFIHPSVASETLANIIYSPGRFGRALSRLGNAVRRRYFAPIVSSR